MRISLQMDVVNVMCRTEDGFRLDLRESLLRVWGRVIIFCGSYPKGRPIYFDGDTAVFEPIQQGIDQAFSLEQSVPVWIVQIGCNDG